MQRRASAIALAALLSAGVAAAQTSLLVPPSEGPIYEVACHEGNLGLANILSGHRAEERAAGGQ